MNILYNSRLVRIARRLFSNVARVSKPASRRFQSAEWQAVTARKLAIHQVWKPAFPGVVLVPLMEFFSSYPRSALANPQGMTVLAGSASAQANGSQLNITTSQSAFLDWRSFNILPGESTRFIQPSDASIVVNRINDMNPSQIWGSLSGNGTVILANAHGFYFGPDSMIKVGGSFIATTAPLKPDFGAEAGWQFTGMPPLASIINYGQVRVGAGRSLFLIAEQIENHGELQAPGGTIGLESGKEVLISERPDGRGLSATVKMPSGSVNNTGDVIADAGTIALRAQVVNQNGLLQADSVHEHNGVIELVASEQLILGNGSELRARGDASPASPGGDIILKSGNEFRDSPGSQVFTTGGANGGNGGNVEISAPNVGSLYSLLDGGAQPGFHAGKLLLDPKDIILGNSGDGSAGDGTVPAGGSSGTLQLNVNSAFLNKNFSEIILQATENITLAQGTTWNLSSSTGLEQGQLTLQAGNNIIFGNNAQILDPNGWSVSLQAGVDFGSGAVKSGVGSIFLNGGAGKTQNGLVQTGQGSIQMAAGQSILVGSGAIRTVGGGDIHLQALAGDINAGTKNDGYQYSISGYSVSLAGLGGIATAAGGDVFLQAGNNVLSTPTTPSGQAPGASGAYGSQPGDVTLIAGNQVVGNFLVRNGTGTVQAGVDVQDGQVSRIWNPNADVGTSLRPINLSLVSGAWNVYAARDIFLNEIRNPNGTFNPNSISTSIAGSFGSNIDDQGNISPAPARSSFLFDYSPTAAAGLWAGNAITLAGANLPRLNGLNQNMPPIYPPNLSLEAGAGGINILNSILLFPSPKGSLEIRTRDGGDLIGAVQQNKLVGITMSDSALPGYNTFALGHALSPLHLNDPNPVSLDISGDIQSLSLVVPTFAHVTVHGNTYNFGFLGRNLAASQTTSIDVTGDISYRGNLTSITLTEPLPAALFDPGISGDPSVARKLQYNSTSGLLSFIGQMSASERDFLLNPNTVLRDAAGNPILDVNGQPRTTPIIMDPAQQAAVQQLYAASQSASLGDQGLSLAGRGKFEVSAENMNLGVSGGISVLSTAPGLGFIPPAQLSVNVLGNLDMTSTKIANESYLGGIDIKVGGKLDVGGTYTAFGDPAAPKGIFTTSGGDLSVAAGGDVNVNGSRIAAFNGGSINVQSANGDVNAGSGAAGFVSLQAVQLDPKTGQFTTLPATIPGSGILATTLPGSSATTLGNITVNAPKGSINASLGGIIQLAFNGADTHNSVIDLHAGHDINAGGSGIIGSNIKLEAGGSINGLIVGSGKVDLHSQQNINATAFGAGGVSISAGGSVSGSVIGPSVSVSADSVSAALIGKSVNASGNTSGASEGVPQSDVARSDAKVAEDASTTATRNTETADNEDEKKKRLGNATPQLAKNNSRVTVILPQRN